MNIVKRLPKNIYSKIRAGEVIEGPFSIIRELIDNSYDADSTEIIIELEKGGIKKIECKDNGNGISRDDLKIVCENHSTSKIDTEKDLDNIKTLGFRGEALFSISSVSRLSIYSKKDNQDSGFMIENHGGKQLKFEPCPLKNGTKIIIEDLFYNMPARKKFLKKPSIEIRKVNKLFKIKSLALFDINMKLINNQKTIFDFKKCNSFIDRVKQIYGSNSYIHNLNIFKMKDIEEKERLELDNLGINDIEIAFSDKNVYSKYRSDINFIVNKRPVEEEHLKKSIRSYYYAVLPRGYYPLFYLYLNIDSKKLDQNVDPTKSEIRLNQYKDVNKTILSLIKKNSKKSNLLLDNNFKSSKNYSFSYKPKPNRIDDTSFVNELDNKIVNNFFDSDTDIENESIKNDNFYENDNFKGIYDTNTEINIENFGKYLKTLFGTYLMFENNDKIIMIDFHAAFERVRYNKLMEKSEVKRNLLFPKSIILEENIHSELEFSKKLEILNDIGIECSKLSSKMIQVISIPDFIKESQESFLVQEIKSFFLDTSLKGINDLKSKIISSIACRTSPKAGDVLSQFDIKKLVHELLITKDYHSCPHGRPTIKKLDKDYFDKLFLRKK